MDIFCEYIVKKKMSGIDFIKLIGIGFLTFIVAFLLFFFATPMLGPGIGFVLVFAAFYFAYIWAKMIYVEYEYALTNNELDIDKIMGRSRRKRIISFHFKDALICACVNDENFKAEYENCNGIKKIINATGISEYDTYFVDFNGEDGKIRVLFQPNDKMKEGLKNLTFRTIHIL